MFRCQICEKVVEPGVRAAKLVVQTRPKTYEPRGRQPDARGFRSRGPRRSTRGGNYDKGGEGREIVREVMVCPDCEAQHAPTETPRTTDSLI